MSNYTAKHINDMEAAFGGGFVKARAELGVTFEVKDYSEHALTSGSGASAVAYVEAEGADGSTWWGVGIDSSILDASLRAVVSAANRTLPGHSRTST